MLRKIGQIFAALLRKLALKTRIVELKKSKKNSTRSSQKYNLETTVGTDYSWIEIAKAEIGEMEIPGDMDNPRIVDYGKAVDLRVSDDETPWCAIFVNWCLWMAGIEGTRKANARSFLDWGRKIEDPEEGCVVVFKRGNSSWKGHVGFYMGEKDKYIKVLGGNQSNSVKYSYYKKSDLLGYRWPEG